MSITGRAVRSALVVIAGMLGVVGVSSVAGAQRAPRIGVAAQPVAQPPQMTTPYPGATVTIDPRLYDRRPVPSPARRQWQAPGIFYAVPVPSGYPYYPSAGYGGGVYDTNGRPLSGSYDAPTPGQYGYLVGTPDLSGSPYVVIRGGSMVVDFGNGDMRTIPSCALLASDRTPDGQSRTIFYQQSSGGLVLRAGQRGRVIGAPPAGARVCYTVDEYGRMVLDY